MTVQLVVTYNDNTILYYPVVSSWRISNADRCIVIGKMPRTYIPLDQVRSFDVETQQSDSVQDSPGTQYSYLGV